MKQSIDTDADAIVVDEVFPHSPAVIWTALTSGALIARWLMAPQGFSAVVGAHFTFQTRPAGAWDGTIRCEVLEVVAEERLSYAWKSGDEGNVGYGAMLETVVVFTLAKTESGTRLRLVHSGFRLPKNEVAYGSMSEGWKKVIGRLNTVVTEEIAPDTTH